jgi:shikimate dehydrogenase
MRADEECGTTKVKRMLEKLNGATRLFPIIGDPIIYVQSPERLTSGLVARGHNGICVPMQVPEGTLESVMQGFTRIQNIDGLLVTMPHKFAAYRSCATSSEREHKKVGGVSHENRGSHGSSVGRNRSARF